MEIDKYIEKQFQEHDSFVDSINSKSTQTMWGEKWFHPKTRKPITLYAKLLLIDNDIKKRVSRIIKHIEKSTHKEICHGIAELNRDMNKESDEHLHKLRYGNYK